MVIACERWYRETEKSLLVLRERGRLRLRWMTNHFHTNRQELTKYPISPFFRLFCLNLSILLISFSLFLSLLGERFPTSHVKDQDCRDASGLSAEDTREASRSPISLKADGLEAMTAGGALPLIPFTQLPWPLGSNLLEGGVNGRFGWSVERNQWCVFAAVKAESVCDYCSVDRVQPVWWSVAFPRGQIRLNLQWEQPLTHFCSSAVPKWVSWFAADRAKVWV